VGGRSQLSEQLHCHVCDLSQEHSHVWPEVGFQPERLQMPNFGPTELVLIIGAIFLAVSSTSIWAFFDARNRGRSGCLVALMVLLLGWPLGLIVWLVFRPRRDETVT